MNPELQRNLWLEASPRRLGWAGVTVALIYAAVLLASNGEGGVAVLDALGAAGAVVFFASAIIWGVRLAGQSVGSEIGERTWDFQRLSALDPWSMTWGKLFGATSLAWLVGLTGLLFTTIDYGAELGPVAAIQLVISAIALAVLLQAAGMSAALVGVRKARAEGRLATLRSAAGGAFSVFFIIFAAVVVGQVAPLFFAGATDFTPVSDAARVSFWGAEIERRTFVTLSLIGFAAWTLIAAWRLMRLELQKRNGPLFWVAFLVFTAVWGAGQVDVGEGVISAGEEFSLDAQAAIRWAVAALIFNLGVYASAFAEPADRVRLRRFLGGLRSRSGDLLTCVPAVLPALALSLIAFIGVIAVIPANLPDSDIGSAQARLFVAAIFAFVVRDVAVIAFLRFGPRPKRGDFGAVLALFLLYALGAMVASNFGSGAVSLVLPSPEAPVVSLVSALAQALFIGALAIRRIRGPEKADTARTGA